MRQLLVVLALLSVGCRSAATLIPTPIPPAGVAEPTPPVPRPTIDSLTWLIGGQSNAVGWAEGQFTDPPLETVQAWNPDTREWEIANDPLPFVAHPQGQGGSVGPWVTAARVVVRSGRVNRIRLTGYAQGSTAIAHWAPRLDNDPIATDDLIWRAFVRAIDDAENVDLFLWFQGESDADRPTEYPADEATLFARTRAAAGKPNLPIIVCGVVNYPGFDAVRAAQRAAVAADAHAYFVPTDDLPNNGQHLTVQGYELLGARIASLVSDIF